MGVQISKVLETVTNDEGRHKQTDDALKAMEDLAAAQLEIFKKTIYLDSDKKTVPISKVLLSDYMVRAQVSTNNKEIPDLIQSACGSFASKAVVKGIADLIKGGLNVLLGETVGSSSTRTQNVISTGNLGGIFRIDLHLYSYKYKSQAFQEIIKDVVAVGYVLSSADTSGLNDNDIRNVVQLSFADSSYDLQQSIYHQIREANEGVDPSGKRWRAVLGGGPGDDQPTPNPSAHARGLPGSQTTTQPSPPPASQTSGVPPAHQNSTQNVGDPDENLGDKNSTGEPNDNVTTGDTTK